MNMSRSNTNLGLAPSPTRLRQITLVVQDLEQARQLLTSVLDTQVAYEDPAVAQWGLRNFLVPLGGDFIEVVAPSREDTTASRLLKKRGPGGYMIIMQTEDARRRREHIEAQRLARIIFSHERGDSVCIQYHPKGIKGGMIPELDSHTPESSNPTPLKSRFSPWHACGSDYDAYSVGMRNTSHLSLQGCVLRLHPDDLDHEAASRQWEDIFGVGRSRDLLAFTNARLGFVRGREGQSEGLLSIVVGIDGQAKRDALVERAKLAGVYRGDHVEMCGVKWYLSLTGQGATAAKL
ncbi:hypothetical protein T440DRAFT_452502 [Plenodomus tracheiphilus IPT5]|uniref:Glyoxalase-like domain-containing protein n=1 Tax=Plenodomus tracheiphilus IPT5 TaxID=1408161 RepID=A0A6A7B2U7_9PLEO|nr:hypothetical protein T440DRAFT_452502 [Plenodomus tracheiphilus IPT5]